MTVGHLVLADGTTFVGDSIGADGVVTGEIVFNTAMTGYQEIVTDPSYAGQIVVMTAPHIGNYGVNRQDRQAVIPWCSGLVVRSISRRDSSWRSEGSFARHLKERDVVALSEIDTRRLTRHIRETGSIPAAMGSNIEPAELTRIATGAPTMTGLDLVSTVTTDKSYVMLPTHDPIGRVVAYDFGIKQAALAALTARGFEVIVVPASTTSREVLAHDPTGVFLSNGPGDPEPLKEAVGAVRDLLGKIPVFGICLGHQILGLALGASTFKLPFGHHGGNHPVRRISDGTVAITSQNHGFAVDLWALTHDAQPVRCGLPSGDLLPSVVISDFGEVVPTYQNLNDGTLEGLECRDVSAFSVQYHPEAAPGPNDASVIFDYFKSILETA